MIGAQASDSIFAFFVAQVVNLRAFLCRPYRVSCYFVVIVFLIDKGRPRNYIKVSRALAPLQITQVNNSRYFLASGVIFSVSR